MALRLVKILRSFSPDYRTLGNESLRLCKPRVKLVSIPRRMDFWEPYREGDRRYVREDKRPTIKKIREGMSSVKGEIALWKEEMRDRFVNDPKVFLPGDTEILWHFDSKENLDKWIVTSDKSNNDGFSECELVKSKSGKGLFCGTLSTELPKDGRIIKAGYCNISTMKAKKSFNRDTYLDWSPFTHMVMRVRGDGRTYMINLHTTGYYDITWHDMYNFFLYTRGGPYWQMAKVPFSRFFLSNKGVLQDKQCRVPLDQISRFGITCADNLPGNFQLEIDYIGLESDENFTENFAYETYQYGKYLLW